MAVLIYTKDNVILKRDTTNTPTLEEVVTTDSPNQIIYIGSGSNPQVISASNIAITSSWAEMATSASYSVRSSTASLATNINFIPPSASYTKTSSLAYNANTASLALQAISASWAPDMDNQPLDAYLSSSWTGSADSIFYGSSSYALYATHSHVSDNANIANYAYNAGTASVATTMVDIWRLL